MAVEVVLDEASGRPDRVGRRADERRDQLVWIHGTPPAGGEDLLAVGVESVGAPPWAGR